MMDRFTAHIDRAWELIAKGESMQAMIATRQALGMNNKAPEVYNLLGYIHAMDGEFDEALSSYQIAMELDDSYLDPILNTAELLLYPCAQPEEAMFFCRQAREIITSTDDLIEVILLETDALLNTGRSEEARGKLEELKELDIVSSSYNLLAARACYEAGEIQEARTYIDKALTLDPECTDAHYYNGLLLREEGKRIEAVTVFLNVLKRDFLESAPIDKKELLDFENKVKRTIELADERTRSMLKGTKIIVTQLPSTEQVCLEFDPRQVVYAEDIDPKRESYKKLWVFVQNFLRMGKSVNLQESELLQIILDEILPVDKNERTFSG